jgi:hypothetical protein
MHRLALLSLALAACSHDNPYFMVDSAGAGAGATTEAGTTADGTTADGTTGPTPTSTSGEPGPGPGGGEADTTEGIDSSTGAGGSTTTTTGMHAETGESGGSTTGEDGSTAGSTDESTGVGSTGAVMCEIDEDAYVELYPLCDAPATEWNAGVSRQSQVACNAASDGAEVLQRAVVAVPMGDEVCDVLELAPSVEPGGKIVGEFPGLTLTMDQDADATLFAEVVCATEDEVGECEVKVTLWVEVSGLMQMPQTRTVTNGAVEAIEINVWQIPGLDAGEPFSVLMQATVGSEVSAEDRVYVIAPRIRPAF